MRGGLFDAQLHNVRRDFEKLHHGLNALRRHLTVMKSSSPSWKQGVDALQSHLNASIREATQLQKETRRVVDEAQTLLRKAPGPDRNLGVGQAPSPPIRPELSGKIRRLEKDAAAVDRELRAYFKTVQTMANDPMRHAAGAEPIDAFGELVSKVADIVEIVRGFMRKNRG